MVLCKTEWIKGENSLQFFLQSFYKQTLAELQGYSIFSLTVQNSAETSK